MQGNLLGDDPADETFDRLVGASQNAAQQSSTEAPTLANLNEAESLGTAGRRDSGLQQALGRTIRDIPRMADKAIQDRQEVVIGRRQVEDVVKKCRMHRVSDRRDSSPNTRLGRPRRQTDNSTYAWHPGSSSCSRKGYRLRPPAWRLLSPGNCGALLNRNNQRGRRPSAFGVR